MNKQRISEVEQITKDVADYVKKCDDHVRACKRSLWLSKFSLAFAVWVFIAFLLT